MCSRAICNGRTLTFIVNDVEIAKVKDEEIPDPGSGGIQYFFGGLYTLCRWKSIGWRFRARKWCFGQDDLRIGEPGFRPGFFLLSSG